MNKQLSEWEKVFANDMLHRGLIPKIYINSVSNKQSQLKMRRPEETFFQRKHIDGQQTHEKMLSITNHP